MKKIKILLWALSALLVAACSSEDVENNSSPLDKLEAVEVVTEGIGDWDAAYLAPAGYYCFRGGIDGTVAGTPAGRSAGEVSEALLTFISKDKSKKASILLSADERLPLQLITEHGNLNFSYPNDSILELLYDDGNKLTMLDSIPYSLDEFKAGIANLSYNTELQRSLYYFVSLVKGRLDRYPFLSELQNLFGGTLELTVSNEPTGVRDELERGTDGTFGFIGEADEVLASVVDKVYYTIALWTGNASFKVGGSSCTLSGTIWCPSQLFDEYGSYGIVCDEKVENLTLDKAEYKGAGKQDNLSLSYGVDFRGLKPNTKYYYTAYYQFNSADHGDLKFKYGDPDAEVAYDQVVKSFVTGDNTLNVDVVMCIDVTGSMSGIISTVKTNALGFYDSFKNLCDEKGINLASLNTQVIAFRDKNVDGDSWLQTSPVYPMPAEAGSFSTFVNGLYANGGGDAPESGLEALEAAMQKTDWGFDDGYHRQVIILWTDAPFLTGEGYTSLTVEGISDLWDKMPSGKRLILFAPKYYGYDGNWDVMDDWRNVIHSNDLYTGFSDFEYILESIINELTSKSPKKLPQARKLYQFGRPNN